MSSSPDAFRAVMRRWPSGVTVITVPSPEGPHGMTASAFTSVSIDPPLILVVVDARWRSHALIHEAGVFCVNLLAEDQSEWSDRFAGRRPELDDRFEGLALSRAETGAPCLDDARGWLDCRLEAAHAAALAGGGGEPPFVAETPYAVMLKHLKDPVPPVRELNPSLPAHVETVLARAGTRSPRTRLRRSCGRGASRGRPYAAASGPQHTAGRVLGRPPAP